MSRLVKLFLVVGVAAAVLTGVDAGPRRGVAPPNPAPTRPRVVEYRTYCDGWKVSSSPQSTPPAEADSRPLVWVVDGAGDLKGCSNALGWANMLSDSPVAAS